MRIEKSITPQQGELTLSGELTLNHAAELKAEIEAALDVSNRTVLKLREVGKVDFACLQLLCAAHKTAAARNKEFVVDTVTPALKAAVDAAGIDRQQGCTADCLNPCLWIAGGA